MLFTNSKLIIEKINIKEDKMASNFRSLSDTLDIRTKTSYVNQSWHNVYPVLKTSFITTEILKCTGIDAKKYIGDLYGLFTNIFNIPHQFLLPYMLVNGYKNPQDYDGKQTEFLDLDQNKLNLYLMAFVRTEKKISNTRKW